MEEITIIEDNELKKWDEFVYNHPAGNIYQTSAWRNIIRRAFGHQPLYFALKNGSGEIKGAMPFFAVNSKAFGKRLTSLPCAQVCNPLASAPENYETLLNYAHKYIKEKNFPYAELKTNIAIPAGVAPLGKPFTGYSTYTLDLSDTP